MPGQAIKTSALKGRYLYAVVSGSQERNYGTLGINGGRVYTIAEGDFAAVVSDVANTKLRPERRHFAAHQAVLKALMQDCDVLPITFGAVSTSPKAVRNILAENRKEIKDQLKRVSGKVEMGLRVAWDVPNIFEYMLSVHPDLMRARDALLIPQREPTREEKIEIGRMFEEMLDGDRERHTEKVEKILRKGCVEVKRNKCRDESEVMNLACLVGRDETAAFESAVLESAGFFDDSFSFDYNGPWAPHNFVDLQIDVSS